MIYRRVICIILLVLFLVVSAFSAQKFVPIMNAAGDNEDTLAAVVAGISNGKWLDAEQTAKLATGNETYRLYNYHKYLGTATGTKPKFGECVWICEGYLSTLNTTKDFEWAIAGTRDPFPRKARIQSPNQKVYIDAVRDFITKEGIRDPKVLIMSIQRVDMEGDGVNEVVITACSPKYGEDQTKEGDYSVVLLRQIIKGKVQTIMLAGEIYNHPVKQQPTVDSDGVTLWIEYPPYHGTPEFWDFDGDGKLEILTRWGCLDAGGIEILKVDKGKFEVVARQLGGA